MRESVLEEDMHYMARQIPHTRFEGKTFLITGATGFLGSYIVMFLVYMNTHYLENKCKIIAMCRNKEKASLKFREYIGKSFFSICQQDISEPICREWSIDYIIHAASIATSGEAYKIPVEVLRPNVIGTYNLLEYARYKKIEGMLFLSSGAVYGEVPEAIEWITEGDVFAADFLKQENSYLVGKRAGEAICRAYKCQYDIPVKIVRISHTYGPCIDLNDGRVFSDFTRSIINHEDLVIKGTGLDVRPFCYVRDAVEAFFAILFEGVNGEAYNMANADATLTISELAEILVHQAFSERKLQVKGKNIIDKAEKVKKTKVDISKLKQLGWMPKIGVVEGFKRTVKSFEEQNE